MKNSIIPLLFCLLLSFSCSSVVEDLGNDYFLAYNAVDDFAIGKKIKGVPTYKSYNYAIHGHVLGYAVNDTFY